MNIVIQPEHAEKLLDNDEPGYNPVLHENEGGVDADASSLSLNIHHEDSKSNLSTSQLGEGFPEWLLDQSATKIFTYQSQFSAHLRILFLSTVGLALAVIITLSVGIFRDFYAADSYLIQLSILVLLSYGAFCSFEQCQLQVATRLKLLIIYYLFCFIALGVAIMYGTYFVTQTPRQFKRYCRAHDCPNSESAVEVTATSVAALLFLLCFIVGWYYLDSVALCVISCALIEDCGNNDLDCVMYRFHIHVIVPVHFAFKKLRRCLTNLTGCEFKHHLMRTYCCAPFASFILVKTPSPGSKKLSTCAILFRVVVVLVLVYCTLSIATLIFIEMLVYRILVVSCIRCIQRNETKRCNVYFVIFLAQLVFMIPPAIGWYFAWDLFCPFRTSEMGQQWRPRFLQVQCKIWNYVPVIVAKILIGKL